LGVLLVRFLLFYGTVFDPVLTGVSVAHGFFRRKGLATSDLHNVERPQQPQLLVQQQQQQQFMQQPHEQQHGQQLMQPLTPHKKVNPQTRQRHQKQRLDNSAKLQPGAPTPQASAWGGANAPQPPMTAEDVEVVRGASLPAAADSHRFDPVFIDDPLRPGNNVGRNCFRFSGIQRELRDAGEALRVALTAAPKDPQLLSRVLDNTAIPSGQPARAAIH
jgi:hypothetical protein